jgi:tetratricopeptide (TPR) repeat protein
MSERPKDLGEQQREEQFQKQKAKDRDWLTPRTSGRGLWIAQGLEPPPELPEERVEMSRAERALITAMGHLAGGRSADAIDAADEALERNPTPQEEAEARRIRAAAHARLELFEQAVEDAERALQLDPDGTSGGVSAATLRANLGSWRLRAWLPKAPGKL